MERGRERPGLGSVDGDLDEPQRAFVLEQSTLVDAGVDVDPAHPLLVRIAVHRADPLDAVGCRGQTLGDAGALTEVVVVGA